MSHSALISVRGVELWGLVDETEAAVRVGFDLEDWQRLRLYTGQRVPVRLSGRAESGLFLTDVVTVPPLVWVTFGTRFEARRLTAG